MTPLGALVRRKGVIVSTPHLGTCSGRRIQNTPALPGKAQCPASLAVPDRAQAVTTPRNEVPCVVTEHGIADLKGRTIRERAEALIAVADPQFQDELREEFLQLYGFRGSAVQVPAGGAGI